MMTNFIVIGINEDTKEKEKMFCAEINGGEITSFQERVCLRLIIQQKKTHYFLSSTSHFGNTS